MSLSIKLSGIADRLRDTAAFGLRFSKGVYEQERFRAVQDAAIELFSLATATPIEDFEPIRKKVLSRPTPFVAGDAAIIDEEGQMLLIRRTDNQKWAMPGGALEVGETPAAGIEREALEETGVRCRATDLVGIHDSRLCQTQSPNHLYHIMYLCQATNATNFGKGSHSHEVLDVRWFAQSDLESLDLDPGHRSRIPEAYRVWRGDKAAYFDRTEVLNGPAAG